MSNEIDKAPKAARAMDGFDGYESRVEGKEEQFQSDRGSSLKLKFLNGVWLDQNEQEVKAELVVLDVQRKVQKWLTDDGPAETIVLAPGARFPDIDAILPRSRHLAELLAPFRASTSSCSPISHNNDAELLVAVTGHHHRQRRVREERSLASEVDAAVQGCARVPRRRAVAYLHEHGIRWARATTPRDQALDHLRQRWRADVASAERARDRGSD